MVNNGPGRSIFVHREIHGQGGEKEGEKARNTLPIFPAAQLTADGDYMVIIPRFLPKNKNILCGVLTKKKSIDIINTVKM